MFSNTCFNIASKTVFFYLQYIFKLDVDNVWNW